jgi:truncated hemoglobin YjbI
MKTAQCQQLSAAFYARVHRDPLLRPLFPGKSIRCATEELTAFLVQYFGGPSEDTQHRWWVSLRESHARFKIGPKERDAWLSNMFRTLDEQHLNDLRDFFEQTSAYLIGLPSHVPPAIEQMDAAVSTVRRGEVPPPFASRSVSVGLLGLMIRGGNPALLAHVRERLIADPTLVDERYGRRTLLQEAVGTGNLALVELLLDLGADLNAGTHPALYSVANECRTGGAAIVRTLIRHGADVNACKNVKRCTPLHMAARRGNLQIAEALLDAGADLEARDSHGDTPLQRALNCRKPLMAELLLARGARRATR